MKFYIRQQCCAAILRAIRPAAKTGVLCRLKNLKNEEVVRLLFPKLIAMNFDQPEAQLFYGHQNKQTCSYCRWRKGRSAFRHSAPLRRHMVQRLYSFAHDSTSVFKDDARAKLCRWGFNYERKCCLLDDVGDDALLVHIPGRHDVFPCLDFRDVLHGVMMFLHRMLMECLDNIPFEPWQRRLLDSRLRYLGVKIQ